jgi:hypothetical protein
MKKTNVAGVVSIASGGLLYGYVALANMMAKSSDIHNYAKRANVKEHQSLISVLPEGNFDWIESLPWEPLRNGADYVATMPLWLLLIIVGVILLLIGGLFIKK